MPNSVWTWFGSHWREPIAALFAKELVYLSGVENEEREAELLAQWSRRSSEDPILIAHYPDDRWVGVRPADGSVAVIDPGRADRVVAPSVAVWIEGIEPLASW
jgi:hypothetical protein